MKTLRFPADAASVRREKALEVLLALMNCPLWQTQAAPFRL
jgi:hypothetical protein